MIEPLGPDALATLATEHTDRDGLCKACHSLWPCLIRRLVSTVELWRSMAADAAGLLLPEGSPGVSA